MKFLGTGIGKNFLEISLIPLNKIKRVQTLPGGPPVYCGPSCSFLLSTPLAWADAQPFDLDPAALSGRVPVELSDFRSMASLIESRICESDQWSCNADCP